MGRASNNKNRGGAVPPRRGRLGEDAEAGSVISIEPWPRQDDDDPDKPVQCRVSWMGTDWSEIVPADQVYAMSEALHRAATQADLMRALLRMDFERDVVQNLTEAVIRHIGKEQGDGVLLAVPAAQSTLKAAVVVVQVVGTEIQGVVDPTEARNMANRWVRAAEASVHDELLHEAMRDVLRVGVERRNQVMAYMRMLGGTRHEPEAIREIQVAALRTEFGLPPVE